MLFNSPEFIVFLILVYCLYLVLPFRPQNYMLLVASYVFYGWWDPRFLFLVVISSAVDFWVGLTMDAGRLTRKQQVGPAAFLIASAVVLLGILPNALPLQNSTDHPTFWNQPSTIPLIFLGSIGFVAIAYGAYAVLTKLPESQRRTCCVAISITTQLGLLGFFKYFNFFVDSLHNALSNLGIESSTWHLDIVLPVGISFYTFQSLSYTIDIYRKIIRPTNRFFDFALFVAYFPQLQAGPIERARHLIPQLSNPRRLNLDQSLRGLFLIVLGFFKKVGIADGVTPVVDQVFGSTGRITWIDVIAGTALFAVQIYCDFSGYTDIARGISKLLGIDLMVNFNQPYFATNPQDFWRRWHISLSTWLRDYLYVPLGGNRGNLLFICRNLMITMVLGGLWHGAAWNFLLWGFYQGSLLCVYKVWREYRPDGSEFWKHPIARLALIAIFFVFVCYGWLLFRAHSLAQVVHFSSLLVSDFGNFNYSAGIPRFSSILGLILLLCMELVQYWTNDARYYRNLILPARGFLIAGMLTIIMIGMSNAPAQFIYFQF
jgi:D-alanyl-lipoteichoic acid acyltransferase DltB (MBOAT superfamily)